MCIFASLVLTQAQFVCLRASFFMFLYIFCVGFCIWLSLLVSVIGWKYSSLKDLVCVEWEAGKL